MKKVTALALCLTLLVGMLVLPASASAPEDFVIVDGVLTQYKGPGGAVVIPAGVTGISDDVFYHSDARNKVTSVVIPEGVTWIGNDAFRIMENLTSVWIPDSIEIIGDSAFFATPKLTDVRLPAGFVNFDSSALSSTEAFWNADRTLQIVNGILLSTDFEEGESAYLPSGVKYIDCRYFQPGAPANTLLIPEGVIGIGAEAFLETRNITKIVLPSTLKFIEREAFSRMYDLTSVNLPEGLVFLGEEAFSRCEKLRSIEIPTTLTRIGAGAFKYCRSLASVKLPNTLREIGEVAFRGTALTKVTIPEGVTKVSSRAFIECLNLSEISLPSTLREIGEGAFISTPLRSVTLPAGLERLEPNAFSNCEKLTSVTLPNSLKVLSAMAFEETGLTSVVIPEGVESIDFDAFYKCKSLQSVQLPSTLKEIHQEAFEDCTALNNIALPDGLKVIQYDAFRGCAALTTVTGNPTWERIDGGIFRDTPWGSQEKLLTLGNAVVGYNSPEEAVVVPEGITLLGEGAFRGRTDITSLTLPSTLKRIQDGALFGCTQLASIQMPPDVQFGKYTFNYTAWFKSLGAVAVFGDTLLNLDLNKYWEEHGRGTPVVVPDGIKRIGSIGDKSLASFEVVLPESVEEIGNGAFGSGITKINLPSNLKRIGDRAFWRSSLTEIDIPASVEYLGVEAFEDSARLTTVHLPEGNGLIPERNAFHLTPWLTQSEEPIICNGLLMWMPPQKTFYEGALKIPQGVRIVDSSAFDPERSRTRRVELPFGVTTVRKGAFNGGALYAVQLPPTIQRIETSAFSSSTYLNWISIPDGVEMVEESFGNAAFFETYDHRDYTPTYFRNQVASPSSTPVLVDGEAVTLEAYLINNNNYVKLRDIAAVLSGTGIKFDVGFQKGAVYVTTGKRYTSVGGELTALPPGNQVAAPNGAPLYIDNVDTVMEVYTINSNNYIKLRDLGRAFGFQVDWKDGRVVIETDKDYVEVPTAAAKPHWPAFRRTV